MHKIIHNLRQRPEAHKRHILHVATVVIAIVMVMLWVFSLGRSLSSADLQKKVAEDVQPLSALKANLIDGYKNISKPELSGPQPAGSTELDSDIQE